MTFKIKEIQSMHRERVLGEGVYLAQGWGMSQYSKEQSGFEFVQLDTESGKVLSAVKTPQRSFGSDRVGDAAWAIANSIDYTRGVNDKGDWSQLKFYAIPCGISVSLFNHAGEWVAATVGETHSDHWLSFIKRNLDGYGVDLSDLDTSATYTFVCTQKAKSPASQDAIYLISESGGKRGRNSLAIPRPEYIPLPIETLFKYGIKWQTTRIEDILRSIIAKGLNLVSPVYSADVRFGNYSWRILSDAGAVFNEFRFQNHFSTFYDFAVATQDGAFQQIYLRNCEAVSSVKQAAAPVEAFHTRGVGGRRTNQRRGNNKPIKQGGRQRKNKPIAVVTGPVQIVEALAIQPAQQVLEQPVETEQIAVQPVKKPRAPRKSKKQEQAPSTNPIQASQEVSSQPCICESFVSESVQGEAQSQTPVVEVPVNATE